MTKICGLKVEGMESPMGIGEARPRFSWQVADAAPGFLQRAYALELASDDGTFHWESGTVSSAESVLVEGCPRLAPRRRFRWRVTLYAEGEEKGISSEWSWFETGKLNEHWKALWIAGIHNGETHQPVNYLRKAFELKKPVASARLYATALGVYDCAINGMPVSDECMAPGWTDYFYRVQHQTYDVTRLLKNGANAIGVRLGDGWYCGTISRRRNSGQASYGSHPVFRAELHIIYEDGSSETVLTDRSWKCSIGGPVRFSDIYDGECYDARMSLGDWSSPDYQGQGWSPCLAKNRRIAIVGRTAPPVRCTEGVAPVEIRDIEPSLWKREPNIPDPKRLTIVDFGQNLVGRIRMRLRLPDGVSISIRHGEMLLPDGSLFLENLRTARAAISLTGNGEWLEYEPLFTFFGFRYLQITNLPDEFDPDSLRAWVLHTDLEPTGQFRCSDELVNRLWLNQRWSNRSNYLDIPTDCNQRDERLGWLGDAWVFAETAAYNFDVDAFFSKWLEDVNLSRTGEGEYPQYAPFFAVNHLDADLFGTDYYKGHNGWADAAIIIPWLLYRRYNDARVLRKHYANMLDWIRYQENNSDGLLRCSCVWRDWLHQNDPTSETLVSTAFFAYGTSLLARIAGVLGKTEDAAELRDLHARIRSAYQKQFIQDGSLIEKSQTAALLTLAFQLEPDSAAHRNILRQLEENIASRGNRLSTGFLGTPFLLKVLTEEGRADLARILLFQKEFPSWLYPVLQGATSIWERWDGYTLENGILPQPMNSFNHYAYGAVASYLYGYLGGIRLSEKGNAFKDFILGPVFCPELSFVDVAYCSPYGEIRLKWRREKGRIELEATVPPNTTATLRLPGQADKRLTSGNFHFSLDS